MRAAVSPCHSFGERCARRGGPRGGYTLIELALVIFVIGILAAIAFPQLMPLLSFGTLEGSARHLSNFGRAAIAEAQMQRASFVVRIDLDRQEYWAVKMIVPKEEGEGELEGSAEENDMFSKLSRVRESGMSDADLSSALAQGDSELGGLGQDFDAEKADLQMNDKFNRFAQDRTRTLAENVKHDEGILDEIGPLFDKEDEFSLEDQAEPEEVEITDPVLERTVLDSGKVSISSIEVNGEPYSRGLVEITFTPMGLQEDVVFYLSNDDGDYFTVRWDPVMASTDLFDGYKDFT